MNIRDLFVPLGIALVFSWAIQYFFFRTEDNDTSKKVHSFVAPRAGIDAQRPLYKEVDFIDVKRSRSAQLSEIDTSWATIVLSTDGASLDTVAFKRLRDGDEQTFHTVFSLADADREKRCFLVALEENTPYFYQLVGRKDLDNTVEVTYQSDTADILIEKIFTIHKDLHKIDLSMRLVPKKEDGVRARLFFPAPLMPSIDVADSTAAIVMTRDGVFKKTDRAKISDDAGWLSPELFGADNRYFVHAMIGDQDNFAERAYYGLWGQSGLFAITEGPHITEEKEWNFSFYFGPKNGDIMDRVDSRLEQTLDYSGILAPLSKGLLAILKWLYRYVHNYGFAIIILTILMKLIMLPFTLRSERSMKQQKEVQKKLAYIQQRYKDNPDQLARERAELLKKYGMPGLGGCLPLLLQMPLFFALSRVLHQAIELYHAPMLWIPDLSSPDPYYVLPILVFISMVLTAFAADPKQRMTILMMALLFGAVTTRFSSGLALYIVISSALSVLQTRMISMFGNNSREGNV